MNHKDLKYISEQKLLILYILKTIGKPITKTQLTDLVMSENTMNFFDFSHYVAELIDTRLLVEMPEAPINTLKLTTDGENALQYFEDRIEKALRQKFFEKISHKRPEIIPAVKISADFIPINFQEFKVRLMIIEQDMPLVDLTLYAGDRHNAKRMCEKWQKDAQAIYENLMKELD